MTKPLGLMTLAGVEAVGGVKVAGSEKEWPVTSAGVRLVNVERFLEDVKHSCQPEQQDSSCGSIQFSLNTVRS